MRGAAALLLLGACSGARPEKIAVLPPGEAARPEEYLTPGYATLLEFTRTGCGPCAELAPALDRLTERYDRLLVRRVDVLRAGTPAWDQMSRDFSGSDVPHVVVFRADGRVLGPVKTDLPLIEVAVRKALGLGP